MYSFFSLIEMEHYFFFKTRIGSHKIRSTVIYIIIYNVSAFSLLSHCSFKRLQSLEYLYTVVSLVYKQQHSYNVVKPPQLKTYLGRKCFVDVCPFFVKPYTLKRIVVSSIVERKALLHDQS